MFVKLKCRLETGPRDFKSPGSVVDLADDEASRLVKNNMATIFDVDEEVDELLPPENDDEKEDEKMSLTIEQAVKALTQIKQIDAELAASLFTDHNISSLKQVAEIEDIDILRDYEGIGKKTAQRIIQAAKEFLSK